MNPNVLGLKGQGFLIRFLLQSLQSCRVRPISIAGLGPKRVQGILTVNPIKLETGFTPNSAGIPYTLLLRIGAIGFPTFALLLYNIHCSSFVW